MTMGKTVHDKAIRLIEGGIVEVDGHCVTMAHRPNHVDPCSVCHLDSQCHQLGPICDFFDPCFVCDMDSLCHKGNAICELCEECDFITGKDCFLILMDKK